MIFQNSPDITSREAVNFEISLAVFIPNTLEAISYKNKDCSMIFWDISFPSLENWNYSVYFPFIWKTTGDNSGSKNVLSSSKKITTFIDLDISEQRYDGDGKSQTQRNKILLTRIFGGQLPRQCITGRM